MTDSDILDWLERHGEEISWACMATGQEYLVLRWLYGERPRCTYGIDLRDAVRGAIAGECMPGQKKGGE